MISLAQLKPGEKGVITKIESFGKMKRRLLDMGFTPGTEVLYQRNAPLFDPIEYFVLDYRLSLRRSEAAKIIVEKIK